MVKPSILYPLAYKLMTNPLLCSSTGKVTVRHKLEVFDIHVMPQSQSSKL